MHKQTHQTYWPEINDQAYYGLNLTQTYVRITLCLP